MKIDVSNLFNSSNDTVEIDTVLDMGGLQYFTYYPIQQGVSVKGSISCRADVVNFNAHVAFVFTGVCDRCAEDITKDMELDIEKVLVKSISGDDYDDEKYIILPDGILDLDELIREEIIMFLPYKMLCREDCKGLCPKCGKNLNKGKCDCKKDINPAMEPLLELLQQGELEE